MSDVTCTNPECPQQGAPISNPMEYPVDLIRCGTCGEPVEAPTQGERAMSSTETDPTPQPEPEPAPEPEPQPEPEPPDEG